jgi:hypothetical protein
VFDDLPALITVRQMRLQFAGVAIIQLPIDVGINERPKIRTLHRLST